LSAARRQRLAKVADLWDEELKTSASALAVARTRADAARRAAEEARARTEAARTSRRELLNGANAEEWRAREAWIDTCGRREERAMAACREADKAVDAASRAVRAAQQKVERLKLVLAKLAEQERAAERRAEQRSDDEFAARISQSGGRGDAR
jgi:flagellar export protein FliJ